MKTFFHISLLIGLLSVGSAHAEDQAVRIAAAADLKYALTEIADTFRSGDPDARIELIFGSSGKFHTQIQNGAPFDLFFSADLVYPRELQEKGLTAREPRLYAVGRIVLWSPTPGLAEASLRSLPDLAGVRKFAIANPHHAPYGRRAQEALEHEGVWEAMKTKLIFGDNIAHTMQFVDSGAAEAGIVALSLVLAPQMSGKGAYTLIPAEWHKPLEQAYVVTARARDNPLAKAFAAYMETPAARTIMRRYGFVLPGE